MLLSLHSARDDEAVAHIMVNITSWSAIIVALWRRGSRACSSMAPRVVAAFLVDAIYSASSARGAYTLLQGQHCVEASQTCRARWWMDGSSAAQNKRPGDLERCGSEGECADGRMVVR